MSKFWSDIVHALKPYVPGEQPKLSNLIKLNTNENPYGPSPKVIEVLQAQAGDALKLYPDPDSERLKVAIAEYYHLPKSHVFVGNGSDEVLAHVFNALLKHDKPLLFPDITYSFYPVYCALYDIEYQTIALDAAFQLNVNDYLQANGGIIFPNPNAPTGIALPLADIENLLQKNTESVVVVDEAYVDFGAESAAKLVEKYPHLLVVQTLSKARSLAGLRVGFALGHPDLIQALVRVKDSFNSYPIDRFAEAGAVAAMQDEAYFEQTRQQVIRTREHLVERMQALGFSVLPSAANFIFAQHKTMAATEIAQALRARSIIVRHFNQPARISNFLRITIGTDPECDALVQALGEIIQ